jgi:hypothetical protein
MPATEITSSFAFHADFVHLRKEAPHRKEELLWQPKTTRNCFIV